MVYRAYINDLLQGGPYDEFSDVGRAYKHTVVTVQSARIRLSVRGYILSSTKRKLSFIRVQLNTRNVLL